MAKDERFVKVYSQGKLTVSQIWVDTVTGVNYFYHEDGYSGGMSVYSCPSPPLLPAGNV